MKKPLRALLLAAGLGTRLRPLTYHTPKCLVTINGEPLLEHWLRKLEILGCESVLINTCYLAEDVEKFLKCRSSGKMKITTVNEKRLLGTAGTLLANKEFFNDSTGLLIHADNLTTDDLSGFLVAHKARPSSCLLTMLSFKTEAPGSCGIIETNHNKIVTSFHEKVANPPGNIANAAVYAFENQFLNELIKKNQKFHDFSNQVIPLMIGQILAWQTQQPYFDIGTPESLRQARSLFDS